MDHISLIIVHYNTDRDTKECLESLAKVTTDHFKFSVIVVDNASKNPFVLPKHLKESQFEVVRSETNLGFTGGNNLGIHYAIEKYNSEYVCLLNSDTYVDKHFLEHLYDCARTSPQAGLFSPLIYFAEGYEYHSDSYTPEERGRVIWYAGGSIDWRNLYSFHRGVDEVDRGQFDAQDSSEFATGCCVLISREVLETVGLFDPAYFLYLEDVDLSIRAQRRGYALTFCPQAKVWHKNAGSTGGAGSDLHQYYQSRNRVWFSLKYGNWRTRLVALKLACQLFFQGQPIEKRAMMDLSIGRLGKQPIL